MSGTTNWALADCPTISGGEWTYTAPAAATCTATLVEYKATNPDVTGKHVVGSINPSTGVMITKPALADIPTP